MQLDSMFISNSNNTLHVSDGTLTDTMSLLKHIHNPPN